MDLEVKCGQMALDMKVIGKLIKLTVKVNSFMLMEIYMKASGSMIKLMVKVLILMLMVRTTMVTGLMINSMDLVWNHGQMVQNMRGIISTVRKREKVN